MHSLRTKNYLMGVGNGFIRSAKGGMHKCIPYRWMSIVFAVLLRGFEQSVKNTDKRLNFFVYGI